MVDQPDRRAAYNDSAIRISANQIPDRPLLAQSGRSLTAVCQTLACRAYLSM